MAVVRYARLARQDLLDIWLWIANDSGVARADDIVARMEGRGAGLADFPEMGVARPDIAPDARSLVVERWLLLYRLGSDGVQIMRVVDGARDLTKVWQGRG